MDVMLRYHCRILFTTRCRYEDQTTLEVQELHPDTPMELMGKVYDVERKLDVMKEIIALLHGHTVSGEHIGADARINHRSHADRGLLEQPTVHEGVVARAMERQGITSDRCELNRQIKVDNAFLRELRMKVEKITKAVMDTIPAIARGLESLRQKMVMYRYQIIHFSCAKWQATDELREVKPDLKRFDELMAEIKSKTQEHKALTAEKKQTPVWSLLKRNDLTKRIAQLTEELEELRSEKTRLLARFDYTEDADMKQAKDWAKLKEKSIDNLRAKENHCEQELNAALAEFQTLSRKADAHNPDTLWQERLKLRKTMSQETEDTLRYHFGRSFSPRRLQSAESDVRLYLEEDEQSMQQYQRRMWQKEQRERRIIQRKELNR